jgi:hypothetical protein
MTATANPYESRQLAEAAQQQTTRPAATSRQLLLSGSSAPLTGGKDLKEYLGQRVKTEGWIADSDKSTIGTSAGSDLAARGDTKDAKPLQPTVETRRGTLATESRRGSKRSG